MSSINDINQTRRRILQGSVAACALGVSGIVELLQTASAAYPGDAFKSESMDEVIKLLFSESAPADSSDITVKAPDIAENGAVVPIKVTSTFDKVEMIAIVVENNPSPLAASFELGEAAVADVSTRIKMGKTSNVYAFVQADGKVFSTKKEVKVTIGGCGG